MRSRMQYASAMRFSSVSALALLAACVPNLSIPSGLVVACDTNADCPTGYFCNPNTKLCISSDNADTAPPTLLATSVQPKLARLDTRVMVELTSSEALREVPKLEFALNDAAFALVDQKDTLYRFSYAPT